MELHHFFPEIHVISTGPFFEFANCQSFPEGTTMTRRTAPSMDGTMGIGDFLLILGARAHQILWNWTTLLFLSGRK